MAASDSPAPALSELRDRAWQKIARGVADRRAPARHPVLATVGREGGGEARIVVLRGADRQAATLVLHTDGASAKVGEVRAEPRATLLVWDPGARLQIRMRATIAARPGGDGRAHPDLQARPRIPDEQRRPRLGPHLAHLGRGAIGVEDEGRGLTVGPAQDHDARLAAAFAPDRGENGMPRRGAPVGHAPRDLLPCPVPKLGKRGSGTVGCGHRSPLTAWCASHIPRTPVAE